MSEREALETIKKWIENCQVEGSGNTVEEIDLFDNLTKNESNILELVKKVLAQ